MSQREFLMRKNCSTHDIGNTRYWEYWWLTTVNSHPALLLEKSCPIQDVDRVVGVRREEIHVLRSFKGLTDISCPAIVGRNGPTKQHQPLQSGVAGEKDEVTVQHPAAEFDVGLRIFPIIRLGEREGVEINLHQPPSVPAAIGRQRSRTKRLGVFPRCEISRCGWTGGLQEQSPTRLARTDATDYRGLKTELLSGAFDELLEVIGGCGLLRDRR